MLAGFTNMTFEFGARVIVQEATWHIQPNERIGLIGYNGAGKSTLLKLLEGDYVPSSGTVERSRTTSIGYLHQDLLSFDTSESVVQVAMMAFARVLEVTKDIDALGKKLELSHHLPPGDVDKLSLEYADKLHEMEALDGYSIRHRTEEVLQGLGFSNADLERPYREFSGGWRMRVLLARMILQQPDLLLLDEPTNHLDLPSIEWLEKYLQHYQGAVVIVSHDKYFLNRMVTKIVELYQRQLHVYNGNYAFYEQEKELRLDLQQRAFENQQDYIRQQERFIERFRAKATKAAAAQSAIKRLEKLERIEETALERPSIRINFQVEKTPGKVLAELQHVTKSFGDINIVDDASAEINRGDKIALIGANGKGKSTLLRIIAGAEQFSGERKWGHNVEESFYAQHQLEALNLEHTILEEMQLAGSQKTELELRTLLGCFLFSGDDVEKKIKVLSGGEKARVALAKTMISKANFLLLDEPTNHLDMHSCDLLIDALNKYEGSYILVSHDRYFISKTANRIWEIQDHKIKDFAGGYEEWVEWNQRKAKNESVNLPQKDSRKKTVKIIRRDEPSNNRQNPSTGINKEVKKELQKQQRLFQQLEAKIAGLQTRKQELESLLTSSSAYAERTKFVETEAAYAQLSRELDALNREYEATFEKIVTLEKSVGE